MYKSSDEWMRKELEKVPPEDRRVRRLEIDFLNIMNCYANVTGPIGGPRAVYIAECAVRHPDELAQAMLEAAIRYFDRA